MNIESLLEMNGGKKLSELEAMTDRQLLEYFEPMLKYTRPDLAVKTRAENPEAFGLDKNGKSPKGGSKTAKVGNGLSAEQLDKLKGMAGQMGFNLDELI